MSLLTSELFGIMAGVLQSIGYFWYLRGIRKGSISAHPLTWIMFAYGTVLLTFLEWRIGAKWQSLILPGVCTLLGLITAYYSLKHTYEGKIAFLDKISFGTDVLITLAYMVVGTKYANGLITGAEEQRTVSFLLVCWNIGIATSFAPLVRNVVHQPSLESPRPWVWWTGAYVLLLLSSVLADEQALLLLYPFLNVVAHGAVALLSARGYTRPRG